MTGFGTKQTINQWGQTRLTLLQGLGVFQDNA